MPSRYINTLYRRTFRKARKVRNVAWINDVRTYSASAMQTISDSHLIDELNKDVYRNYIYRGGREEEEKG